MEGVVDGGGCLRRLVGVGDSFVSRRCVLGLVAAVSDGEQQQAGREVVYVYVDMYTIGKSAYSDISCALLCVTCIL